MTRILGESVQHLSDAASRIAHGVGESILHIGQGVSGTARAVLANIILRGDGLDDFAQNNAEPKQADDEVTILT